MSVFPSWSQDKTEWEGRTRKSSELLGAKCQFPDFSVQVKTCIFVCCGVFLASVKLLKNSFKAL